MHSMRTMTTYMDSNRSRGRGACRTGGMGRSGIGAGLRVGKGASGRGNARNRADASR